MTRVQFRRLPLLVVVLGLAGCSRLHPVEGKLVWSDGQPAVELAGSMVCFESTEHRTISRAVVQDDGRFQLTTERPDADGVPRGQHKVYVIEKRRFVGEHEGGRVLPTIMDMRFANPETSGLKATVPPSEIPVVFKVERTQVPAAKK